MSVLQTSIRDSRLKSLAVTCSQRSQQHEMNEYFITPGCRTGVAKRMQVSHLGRDHRSVKKLVVFSRYGQFLSDVMTVGQVDLGDSKIKKDGCEAALK